MFRHNQQIMVGYAIGTMEAIKLANKIAVRIKHYSTFYRKSLRILSGEFIGITRNCRVRWP